MILATNILLATEELLKLRQQQKDESSWKYLDNSLNNCEGLTQWDFVTLGTTLTYTTSNLNNPRNCLEDNQCIDGNRRNHRNRHPQYNLLQVCRGSKYVFRFGYGPLKICNNTLGKVSGSMNADSINMMHTSQQSTKEDLNEELEGYFSPRKLKTQRKILD